MTSEGLGEIFKDDFADMCAEKLLWCRWGPERMVKRAQTWGEDPHWRQWNFVKFYCFRYKKMCFLA